MSDYFDQVKNEFVSNATDISHLFHGDEDTLFTQGNCRVSEMSDEDLLKAVHKRIQKVFDENGVRMDAVKYLSYVAKCAREIRHLVPRT